MPRRGQGEPGSPARFHAHPTETHPMAKYVVTATSRTGQMVNGVTGGPSDLDVTIRTVDQTKEF